MTVNLSCYLHFYLNKLARVEVVLLSQTLTAVSNKWFAIGLPVCSFTIFLLWLVIDC